MSEKTKNLIKCAAIRALKTFLQCFIGYLSAAAVISDVEWTVALSASVLAAIVSLATSFVNGLPECPEDGTESEE